MGTRRRFEVLDVGDPIESTGKQRGTRYSIHSLHTVFGVLLIGLLLGQFAVVYYIDGILPEPLTIKDEEKNPESFIAERAETFLESLTNIGPRNTGSHENEVLAVELIKTKINDIKMQANKVHDIEIDQQVVSGSYYLDSKADRVIKSYNYVQNVVARFKGQDESNSLLVNAHFDSVPTSPGASDDGIMCAVMLEILEKLSKLPQRPKHNVIFLFNGAEEVGLLASHGFITQHKWANETRIIINLEAAGSASRETLFQTGPQVSWLLNYYLKVPHPSGQVAGEEIFQNNLVPSDTDFRIFRDFGDLVGYDFAFARNGYRYHTKYDAFRFIPLSTYQHVGDNLLKLIKEVANSDELPDPKSHDNEKSVYFDVLGFAFIAYKESIGIIVNIIVVLISFVVALMVFKDFKIGFTLRSLKYILVSELLIIASFLCIGLILFTIIHTLKVLGLTMSWFTNSWIIFGLYAAPYFAISLYFMEKINYFKVQDNLSISVQTQLQIQIKRCNWTIILLLLTLLKIRSAYLIMVPVLMNSLVFILIGIFKWQHSVRKWQILYIICMAIPTCFVMQHALLLLGFFVPITARMGYSNNPELFVGVISLLMTHMITSYYEPLILLIRNPRRVVQLLLVIFVVTLGLVVSPMGFPYSANESYPTPQRYYLQHSTETYWDESGSLIEEKHGILFVNMDPNSPKAVAPYIPELQDAVPIGDNCEKYLCCGFPLGTVGKFEARGDNTWIPFEPPVFKSKPILTLNSKSSLDEGVTRFNFTLTQTSHYMNINLKSKNGSTIDWTTSEHVHFEKVKSVNIVFGSEVTPLNFLIDVKAPASFNGAKLDIVVAGRNVFANTNDMTQGFKRILNSFPQWAHVTPSIISFESFVF